MDGINLVLHVVVAALIIVVVGYVAFDRKD